MNSSNTFPNGLYAPYGFNDNNFNRQSFPSNTYPMKGGLPGNPLGRFNPMTTNTQKLGNMSNFQQAYIPHEPLIEKIDYANQNVLLHNNVGDPVLDEQIIEYRLNIDSSDRDIRRYPDPFSFVVKFSSIGVGKVEIEEYIDSYNKAKGTKIEEQYIHGPPLPYINREFRNVKYVKLENIILPQFNVFHEDENDCFVCDKENSLVKKPYVSLVIKELNCSRTYNTSDNTTHLNDEGKPYTPPKPFALIIPDKIYGKNYAGTPYYGTKIFYNSQLGNLAQLSIDFCDSRGLPIRFEHLLTYEDLRRAELESGSVSQSDPRHPLNEHNQVHLSLLVGVVESQINTNTKFEF
jgi:hypothetical protein